MFACWAACLAAARLEAFCLLSWNTGGNGAADWSLASPQVQAIGRHLQALDPDAAVLLEIPADKTGLIPEFVSLFLPGYAYATNSGTDGYLRSVVLSRYPIARSRSWLDDAPLAPFGYKGKFTRDLFEAEIAAPGYPDAVHVFAVHLKNGSDPDSTARRAAEARAISNFFATAFLPSHPNGIYLLAGDLNEDFDRHPDSPVKAALANAATGLFLTRPTDAEGRSARTWSTRLPLLVARLDYVLPCGSLYAAIAAGEVFRLPEFDPPPAPLRSGDDVLASDHVPLRFVFRNPDNGPFDVRILRGKELRLEWKALPGYTYQVFRSPDLRSWRVVATFFQQSGRERTWTVPVADRTGFFKIRRIP